MVVKDNDPDNGERLSVPPDFKRQMHRTAQELRRKSTPAEGQLWQAVRQKQLAGRKFRRQVPIGGCIVDFYCPSEKLVVEFDGSIHNFQQKEDRLRQEALEMLSLRVIRFTNEQVLGDLDSVLKSIYEAFNATPPP